MAYNGEAELDQEKRPSSILRLVVKSSAVLPPKRRVAILDSNTEVQVGRDRPASQDTPRIRLKELEVSKIHATLYWDSERESWAIVDMGSKHGSFVLPSSASTTGNQSPQGESYDTPPMKEAVRLSAPRMASLPRTLSHLDHIRIASTIFQVHIHPDRLPCLECTCKDGRDIPLFSPSTSSAVAASDSRIDSQDHAVVYSAKPELGSQLPTASSGTAVLSRLKREMLSHYHSSEAEEYSTDSPSREYVDRSAKRRALHPSTSYLESPGVNYPSALPAMDPVEPVPRPLAEISTSTRSTLLDFKDAIASGTTKALPSSNIGHMLLMKQGWSPGLPLGADNALDGPLKSDGKALIEPLPINLKEGRQGIGMKSRESTDAVASHSGGLSTSWKDLALHRRWNET